jgi:hypothetical protein
MNNLLMFPQILLFHKQSYERMNLADALVPKTYSKGDRIITQGMNN